MELARLIVPSWSLVYLSVSSISIYLSRGEREREREREINKKIKQDIKE